VIGPERSEGPAAARARVRDANLKTLPTLPMLDSLCAHHGAAQFGRVGKAGRVYKLTCHMRASRACEPFQPFRPSHRACPKTLCCLGTDRGAKHAIEASQPTPPGTAFTRRWTTNRS
jgi:hypothetical protein